MCFSGGEKAKDYIMCAYRFTYCNKIEFYIVYPFRKS
jgi:hypothetical protein